MTRVRGGLGVVLLAVVLTLAGCDGDSGGGGGGSDNHAVALLDRLAPASPVGPVVVDVAWLRRALGVGTTYGAQSTDPAGPTKSRFTTVVSAAFPLLASARKSVVRDAIDLGRVTAAASNSVASLTGVSVLASDQPFEDVSKALVAGNYSLDGEVWRAPADNRVSEAAAVAGVKGLIIVGRDVAAVRAVAQGKNGGIKGTARELVESLNAPAVAVFASQDGACPKAIAAADDIKDSRGRLVVLAAGARADRLANPLPLSNFRLDEPKVDGDRLTALVTYDPAAGPPLQIVGGELSPDMIYKCE
jgi:hypothetical protein